MERVNTHCHCVYSGHGTGTIAEYADAAAAAGLTTLAFTEHFPLSAAFDPDEYLSMRPQMVNAYLAEIDEARARHPQIEFVTGTEMDYLGALEDRQLTEEALAPFRFRLLSVHFIDGWAFDDPDQKARWKEPGAPDAIWRRYGELWCEAASNASLPYDAMSHPDLAKKFGYYPSFSLESLYDEMAEAARARRPQVEVNTVGRLLRLRRDVPGPGCSPPSAAPACPAPWAATPTTRPTWPGTSSGPTGSCTRRATEALPFRQPQATVEALPSNRVRPR